MLLGHTGASDHEVLLFREFCWLNLGFLLPTPPLLTHWLAYLLAVEVIFDHPPSFFLGGVGDELRFLLAEQSEEQRH